MDQVEELASFIRGCEGDARTVAEFLLQLGYARTGTALLTEYAAQSLDEYEADQYPFGDEVCWTREDAEDSWDGEGEPVLLVRNVSPWRRVES